MGIPRLRQLLEPYAETAELKGRRVVIDGPGLAYLIFSKCQSRAPSGSLFDQPSYATLGDEAVKWLDDLTNSGAILSALYFDGYLPASKEPERKRRLVDLSTGLRSYFSLYPSGVPEGASPGQRTTTSATSKTSRKAPVLAFLVPAVLEALRGSAKYKHLIKMVPGEADSFCAKDVEESGGVVITSDTDLLVHDLGPEGSVAFYNDVALVRAAGGKSAVKISEYSVWRICQRLSLPQEKGILSLAFELSMNTHLTLNQAIQRAQEGTDRAALKKEYADFILQYRTPELAQCGPLELSLTPDDALDPRVSELIFQMRSIPPRELPSWCSDMRDETAVKLPMYLLALVDSPSRTSAWEYSQSLRQLAYGIINLYANCPIYEVAEFRRIQQPTSTGIAVPVCTEPSVMCMSRDMVGTLGLVRGCVAEPGVQWIALAITLDILGSQEDDRGRVLSLEMLHAEANGSLCLTGWDFLHMFAHIQALYYSIRMIEQVCDFVGRRMELPGDVATLRRAIADVPPLAGFPSITTFANQFAELRHKIDLRKLANHLGVSGDISAKISSIINPKKKAKNKRKRSTKDSNQDTAARPSPRSQNMFDLLGSN